MKLGIQGIVLSICIFMTSTQVMACPQKTTEAQNMGHATHQEGEFCPYHAGKGADSGDHKPEDCPHHKKDKDAGLVDNDPHHDHIIHDKGKK